MQAAYLYLLRVPIAGALVLGALAPLALVQGSPAAPLLRGTFDVDAAGVGVITFFTGLLIVALVLTTLMVVRYGCDRFGVPKPSPWLDAIVVQRGDAIIVRRYAAIALAVPLVAGLILVGGLLSFARPPLVARALTAIAGASAALVVTGATLYKWSRTPAASAHLLATIVLWTPDGYLREEDSADVAAARDRPRRERPTLLPGHGLLALMTAVTFAAYAAFGTSKYLDLSRPASAATPLALPAIPTLACIVVLITLAVYVTAGLAFLLDRFRVPILVPLLLVAVASSDWPQSDNYFVVHAMPEPRLAVPPAQALAARRGDTAIVVTASGGGIHAAAWTASIVAQLEQQFGNRFHESVRLISAVSGGSVGTMYIVDAIEKGRFRSDTGLDVAFNPASTSSLDDIAWGLVYPDLTRLFAPFLVSLDRGKAAELAWRRLAPDLARPLTAWRPGALSGAIPSVIFNATLADTGGRLVIGTTDLAYKRGLQSFSTLYDETGPPMTIDPAIVTAARLSASFTYVSPAARIDRSVARSQAYHVVDGGYFDNYGVASAVDWLDAATRDTTPVAHVLVLQIRGPVALQDPDAKPGRGTLQQIAAPFSTLLHFRDAAQVAHNNQELQLLCRALAGRHVTLETAVFQYPKCSAPLSWHLTQPERDAVWNAYADPVFGRPRGRVESFLNREFADAGSCGVFEEKPPAFVDPACR